MANTPSEQRRISTQIDPGDPAIEQQEAVRRVLGKVVGEVLGGVLATNTGMKEAS
jgi:hypothetical protein